ncbi:anthranilate phosphoribosyltransferase [Tundrisphaera sp. TA3]|uniref:anthranilate phosphoribosyltransferase n=1 Tax=Tundrisphaera sp. TA3 TaxID=3435775 RepID=UPI003EB838DA
MNPLHDALRYLGEGLDLTREQSREAVAQIMGGEVPEPMVAAFLTALRVRGETPENLAGAVQAVRDRMVPLDSEGRVTPSLDTCGTGGDGACSVNISTATAIVVAACGVPVTKHGNRSATGNSGSAEVLVELGVSIEVDPTILRRCRDDLGLTFLFAPMFHPALRFASPVRRQLPFRTLFNLIGPLVNPALPTYQLIGVPLERVGQLMARVIEQQGLQRAAIVTGADGLDEVSLGGPTKVLWVQDGSTRSLTWTPDTFGLPPVHADQLRVSGPAESAARIRDLFAGRPGPARDTVLANSAAALLVAGRVGDLREGVDTASRSIDTGAASSLLERWGRMSRGEA